MDKSLDELIAEQRSKGKRHERSDHGKKKPEAESRGRDRRHPGSNRDSRRDSKKQDAAGPPPRDPAYYEVRGAAYPAAAATVLSMQCCCCTDLATVCFVLISSSIHRLTDSGLVLPQHDDRQGGWASREQQGMAQLLAMC